MDVDFQRTYYGRISYEQSLKLQQQAIEQVKANPLTGFLMGFEFDPVITLGRRGDPKEDLLEASDTPIFYVERGGQATLHSPGQLVVYPICNIRFIRQNIKCWVANLLKNTEAQLAALLPEKAPLLKREATGIFLGEAKVTSIGIRITGGVSSFGLAINLKNDPQLFRQIRPCGRLDQRVENMNYEGELEDFFHNWCEGFKRYFE